MKRKQKSEVYPLTIFPARVPGKKIRARAVDDPSSPLPAGAAGGVNVKTGDAYIPTIDTAYARTVRVHESLHAIYSPIQAYKGLIDQGIEDARIHLLARLQGSPRRDELATALYDLRTASKITDYSQRGVALVMILRALAIIRGGKVKPGIVGMSAAGYGQELRCPILRDTFAKVGGAVIALKIMHRALDLLVPSKGLSGVGEARELLKQLFADPSSWDNPQQGKQQQQQQQGKQKQAMGSGVDEDKPEEADPQPGNDPTGEDKPEDKPAGEDDKPADKPAGDEGEDDQGEDGEVDSPEIDDSKVYDPYPEVDTFKRRGPTAKPITDKPEVTKPTITQTDLDKLTAGDTQVDTMSQRVDPISVDMLTPELRTGIASKGRARKPRMTIVNLHHIFSKKTSEGRGFKPAMSGARVNSSMLAQAAISPTPVKILGTPAKREMGGTLLIDASGSMDITDSMLYQILELAPLATVAYFNGQGFGKGWLVIFADKGKAYKGPLVDDGYGGIRLPYRYGGNDVDFPAIQWLLRQQAPRAFVGDLGACGPDQIYCDAAVQITLAAEKKGMLKRYASVQEYIVVLEREYKLRVKHT